MGYLEDFQVQLDNRDFTKFMQLWEEYCTSDEVDSEEFKDLLKAIKKSELAKTFGKYVETALPLLQLIKDKNAAYETLSLLIDLQNTNTPLLAELTLDALKARYGDQPNFNERLKLVGLRTKENFQGALSSYNLLAHMAPGKFVFHTGGWGTGEIIEISTLREQLIIEFENVSGRKDLSFNNAFKVLIPLQDDHFLARRFSDADKLELEARNNPVEIIRLLLRDLGSKSSGEIKDELCDLVIPEPDWTKWWQATRVKLKKDTMIEAPKASEGRDLFHLRKSAVTHQERFRKAMDNKTDVNEIIHTTYSYARDFPDMMKQEDVQNSQKEKLLELLNSSLTKEQEFQIVFFLENQFNHQVQGKSTEKLIKDLPNPEEIINSIAILAFKKRALVAIRDYRQDWSEIFLSLMFVLPQMQLRDYILKELQQPSLIKTLEARLQELLKNPSKYPEAFVWYFQKVANKENVPFNDKKGQCDFLEGFLILLNIVESKPEYRDLTKKMSTLLCGKRFAIVRSIIEDSSIAFIKEFLLLISKCHSFTDHDLKILRSLAAVVHPSLETKKKDSIEDEKIVWTTEEGYMKTQERVRQIGTTEMVENAREIETARAHGDLRENSEYKFALEKRSRLQGELKMLSEQLNHARVITKDDIRSDEVSVGTIVDVVDSKGKKIRYTILGPWDADPEKNILSFQTKLVQSMVGSKVGDTVQFREEELKITGILPFLK